MSAGADRSDAVVIATRNAGKTRELRALLAPLGRPVVDLQALGLPIAPVEDTLENDPTFEGNALAKARYFAARVEGRAVVADDSGLCVAALGGAPGVRSRRYSGTQGPEAAVTRANSAKLLREMRDVADRRAEFVCAVAYVAAAENARELVAVGRTSGHILHEPRGTHGFGYDPLFYSHDLDCTFAEAGDKAKSRVSHRARAIAGLLNALTPAAQLGRS